jgi:hypothetical protein
MELPNVDNEFIGLFVPETSPFNTEDILEEFKIYIFNLMKLSIDMVLQEQVYCFNKRRLITNTKIIFSGRISSLFSTRSSRMFQKSMLFLMNPSKKLTTS